MSLKQAVVRLDHARAEIHGLAADATPVQHLHADRHDTGQHRSGVRDEHEFFASVCAAIDKFDEVLVTGARQATADFERYVAKHHPATARRVVGHEVVDHPSAGELVAFGRAFFERRARLGGVFEASR